jgi:Folylpolyglutamate synthase
VKIKNLLVYNMLKNDIELFVEKFSENLPRSLERIYGLLDRIDNPQNSIKNVIHIAGTNGKGSVLSYIKSCY